MKKQERSNKPFSLNFETKRMIFLGCVAILLVVILIMFVYSLVFAKSKPGTTSLAQPVSGAAVEDGKIKINDLYEGEITIPDYNVPLNTYDTDKFKNDNGLVTYTSDDASLGIDVSEFQGDIDWATVKASGIDYAIIRVGYRGATRGKLNEDANFKKNYEAATAAGVDVGVYFFSQAVSVAEAEEEAGYVLQLLQDKTLSYPVIFDWEISSVDGSRTAAATGEQITSYASAFCKKIDKAGFTAGVYFNRHLGYDYYNLEELKNYEFWLAEYRNVPAFYYNFQMWQYSDNAQVQGIDATVDINVCFKKYK